MKTLAMDPNHTYIKSEYQSAKADRLVAAGQTMMALGGNERRPCNKGGIW